MALQKFKTDSRSLGSRFFFQQFFLGHLLTPFGILCRVFQNWFRLCGYNKVLTLLFPFSAASLFFFLLCTFLPFPLAFLDFHIFSPLYIFVLKGETLCNRAVSISGGGSPGNGVLDFCLSKAAPHRTV